MFERWFNESIVSLIGNPNSIAQGLGLDSVASLAFGIVSGIVVTGVLFGLMHGYQLGWAWAHVATLIGVGIIFTIVRSRAETTLASFLMHLGYNSTIALLGTLGLFFAKYGKVPPPHP